MALQPSQGALHRLIQLVESRPGVPAKLAQSGAGIVQHFPRRADGRADGLLQHPEVGDVFRQGCQQGQIFLASKGCVVEVGRLQQVLYRVEFFAP